MMSCHPEPVLRIAVRGAVGHLCQLVGGARSLCELRAIDSLLTHDIFEALCRHGMPIAGRADLVRPGVEALRQPAVALHRPLDANAS
jgi:hypothetical protein